MFTVKSIINNKLWLSSILSIIVSLIIIPLILSYRSTSFIDVPKGVYIKAGNRIFYNFLETVKQENGILVLGTSETRSLGGNNYFSLLNKDKEFGKRVYTLGGAGRSANVYFPLIIDNPKAFNDLEIIYYINPTYWRKGLNSFSIGYFNRYVDSSFAYAVKKEALEKHIYTKYMNSVITNGNNFSFVINRFIDNYKSFYYYDLNELFTKNKIAHPSKININSLYSKQEIKELKHKINLDYNVTSEFLEKNVAFPIVDTVSTYQYDMLVTFIQLTKEYNINCKFYLGPYNEIYCQRKNPDFINDYRKVIKKLKLILTSNDVDFIDGSNLSTVSGTFLDAQHISEYGAYLTALQIKDHYEKRN